MSTFEFSARDRQRACFKCRRSFNGKPRICPNCGNQIHVVGNVFKAPKSSDKKQWEAIEMLYRGGVRYDRHHSHFLYEYLLTLNYEPENWYRRKVKSHMYGYSLENPVWKLPLYQFERPRPSHPRDVPDYLNWWWGNIRKHVIGISRLCLAFDLPQPTIIEHNAVVGWLNLKESKTPCE